MAVDFYYKGLMDADDFFRPYTPEQSAEKAKGSMYEAWFDALKLSPWYVDACVTGQPQTDAVRECLEKFGDIRPYTFKKWWTDIGFRIFAENTRYEAVQVRDVEAKVELKYNMKTGELNNLLIEVPINIHPRKLQEQFAEIIKNHSRYFDENLLRSEIHNRFDESDAEVTFDRDSKLTYKTISLWLKVYKVVEAERVKKKGATLDEVCRNLKLRPSLFKEYGLGTQVDDPEVKRKAASASSEYYKKAVRLIAHATEMKFPCVDRDLPSLNDSHPRQRV